MALVCVGSVYAESGNFFPLNNVGPGPQNIPEKKFAASSFDRKLTIINNTGQDMYFAIAYSYALNYPSAVEIKNKGSKTEVVRYPFTRSFIVASKQLQIPVSLKEANRNYISAIGFPAAWNKKSKTFVCDNQEASRNKYIPGHMNCHEQ
jgi:hypothetical protein